MDEKFTKAVNRIVRSQRHVHRVNIHAVLEIAEKFEIKNICKLISTLEDYGIEVYTPDPRDNTSIYCSEVQNISTKQQANLVEKAVNGDKSACDELIKAGLKTIATIAQKYAKNEDELQDLIQEGNLYVVKTIKELAQYSENKNISVNSYIYIRLMPMLKRIAAKEQYPEISLDELSEIDHEDMKYEPDWDIIGGAPYLHEFIQQNLTPREQRVLNMYYGFNDTIPMSLSEIGKTMHVTGGSVRYIIKRSFCKFRRRERTPHEYHFS